MRARGWIRIQHISLYRPTTDHFTHLFATSDATATASMTIGYSTIVLLLLGLTLAETTHAGHVDFYSDVNFKHRLTRVTDVAFDTCYTFTNCEALDEHAMSAKWSRLPDTGNTNILFYSTHDCKAPKMKYWKVGIQDDADPNFPTNFQLDGIANAISSFNVIKNGGTDHVEYICGMSEMANTTTSTTD